MAEAVHFIGLLRSPVSWAKVGREVVAALAGEGAYVSAVSLKGYLYDKRFALAREVEEAVGRERREGWDVALDYPPNFARLNGKRKAGIVIYEADRLPAHWVEAANRYLDVVIVPSEFGREAAVRSGVEGGRLRVVPFGVNTEVYSPERAELGQTRIAGRNDPQRRADFGGKWGQAPVESQHRSEGNSPRSQSPFSRGGAEVTGRAFNFLTVGAAHVRKGLAETVEAFCEAFGPGEDAGLVIKCPALAQLGRRPWEYARVEDFLADARGGQIALIEGAFGEEEMAALYRGCDVYVQASYGEAFGLAAVEAAACGKAVVTTGWGAAGEIFDEESAYIVDYELIDAGGIAYDWPIGGHAGKQEDCQPRMARPLVKSLAAAMRRAYEDGEGRGKRAEAALAKARRMTWARTARGILESIG